MSGIRHHIRTFWQRVRTEPGLRRNVILLVVALALGLTSGGIILGSERAIWPWQQRTEFWATFDNAPAVSPGNGQEVRIAGVSVGQIVATRVSDAGKAQLQLSLDPKYSVYDNASVVLRPKSPLNEMYIELSPGGKPGHRLGQDGVLPATRSQRPVQVDEVLAHLDTNTRAALTTMLNESDVALSHAPQNLPGGVSELDKVTKNLGPVVNALQQRKDTLAKLVTALAQISNTAGGNDARLASLATNLQKTLRAAGNNTGPLDSSLAQLPDFASQLKKATGSVQSLSGQLDPTLRDLHRASDKLPGALSKLSHTVDRVGSTVDDANPVVAKAKPVVSDLRPFVTDLNASIPDLHQVTKRLNPVTSGLLPYLTDLDAFVYNTASVTSVKDANGGILRGLLEVTPSSLPVPLLQSLTGGKPSQPHRSPLIPTPPR